MASGKTDNTEPTVSIATFNVNGIRAAARRGFSGWLGEVRPDVVALQELRCSVDALPAGVFGDYHVAYDPGSIAGRNGVAFLTRREPLAVRTWGASVWEQAPGAEDAWIDVEVPTLSRGLAPFVTEGRYIEIDLPGLTLANVYLPKGGLPAHLQVPGRMRDKPDGGAKYERKQKFLASFARQLSRTRKAARARGNQFLLMGDLNIAHQNVDVTNWRGNQKTDGFLPEERQWFGEQVGPRTLVDVVRRLHGNEPGPNSWWSWAGQAYEKDVGWRIDYHLASPGLAKAARSYRVNSAWDVDGQRTRMSDHAAVIVEYEGIW